MNHEQEIDQVEHIDTIVVGGSQAGLAMGYHLQRAGVPFLILDANERVGDVWRSRWDSLRLFTPTHYDGLPGMRFPGRRRVAPAKDEMADYLEAYAAHFALPVRAGTRVDGLSRQGDGFVITAGARRYVADHVVVATGAFSTPVRPAFAPRLDARIVQMHSSEYRNPTQLRPGGVLLVGAGNSGSEIALDVAVDHPTWLSGRHPGHVPFRIEGRVTRHLVHVVRFVGHHVLTRRTPIGRKVFPKLEQGGDPVVRVKPKDVEAAGVECVPRVTGVRDGLPALEDDRVLNVANVIWCTGYRPSYSWIDLPVFTPEGTPRHERGVVDAAPGLYFLGLFLQYAATSAIITGVRRDAAHIAQQIVARRSTRDAGRRRADAGDVARVA
jgi:putative flavoprotein involved in K+ transport